MELDIHCVRTQWIRGFSTLRRLGRAQHAPRKRIYAPPAPQAPVGSPAGAWQAAIRSASLGGSGSADSPMRSGSADHPCVAVPGTGPDAGAPWTRRESRGLGTAGGGSAGSSSADTYAGNGSRELSITHRPYLTSDSYQRILDHTASRRDGFAVTTSEAQPPERKGPTATWSLTGKIAPPGQLVSGKPGFGKPGSGTSGAGGAWPPAGGCPTTGRARRSARSSPRAGTEHWRAVMLAWPRSGRLPWPRPAPAWVGPGRGPGSASRRRSTTWWRCSPCWPGMGGKRGRARRGWGGEGGRARRG